MTIHHQDTQVTLHHGDCLDVLATLPDASVDAVVTDPPYALGFMSKEWDRHTPGNFQNWCEQWAAECLRVLKPGGHMVAFGGTRTFHRLTAGIEDAGFEVRDVLSWLYGSGFPKSMDVGKAIDKAAGAERPVVGVNPRAAQQTPKADATSLGAFKGTPRDLTGAATPEAAQWEGWGTALKPAWEPIVLARKPLVGTVAGNVLAHGTGALNIDASRVGDGSESRERVGEASQESRYTDAGGTNFAAKPGVRGGSPAGRWPANLVLDPEAAEALDQQSGTLTSGRMAAGTQRGTRQGAALGMMPAATGAETYGDSGGASRFFYVAKAGKKERPVVDGVAHPTVKPLALMEWLIRMVTPPGGVVLDPFAGSGTTLEAAQYTGNRAVGIEKGDEYLPLIVQRLERQDPRVKP